jgi:hypothetical protein
LPIKLQGWRFSPCKRLVKDFSLEEEIHLLFAQRLERAEEFYPFIWTADLRQSESVSSSQRFLGLAVLEKTFAAAELVGGIGLVFYSLEIFIV